MSLDQPIPEEYREALGDHLEIQSYQERLLFVKRRLGLMKHRALAQATSSSLPNLPMSMDVSPLEEGR